jgi:acyl-CoA carboxylase subunit beta
MTATGAPTRAARRTTRALLGDVLDSELDSWDGPVGSPPPDVDSGEYRRALTDARARSGHDEAVFTGTGRVAGRRIAVVAGEFGFLAGSVGTVAATRIVEAVERATAEGLPILGITASGGTRMQEGTPAFLRMAGIAAAIAEHRGAGLPYITYLRHPTTGGVLASWGSLGHITLAEPGALIGFLGPKVYAALYGEPFPDGVQTAEHLHQHGLVDAVVAPQGLRASLQRILTLTDDRPPAAPGPRVVVDPVVSPDAWACVTATRDPARPGLRDLLVHATDAFPLTDMGSESTAHGAVLALVRFGRRSCVLFGHDREAHPSGQAGLRLARRAMDLAAGLRLPLVTVIDTPGTELSIAAEEQGTAREIAGCLAAMAALPVPTVSVMLGQGAGGAALAVLPADRTVAAKHSWITPLPPEGASAILYGSADRAAAVSEQLQIRATDLLRHGVVDVVVDERPDAATEPAMFLARMTAAIEEQLHRACVEPADARRARRRGRWRAPPHAATGLA